MTFILICIGALIALGIAAALLSRGDDTPVIEGKDCASCSADVKRDCKVKCLLDEQRQRKAERAAMSVVAIVILTAIAGCSTEKNTANTRRWHAFTTRYNVYYNGNMAYIDGSLEKEQGNRDNFTEMIPLYTVGNKNSRELGKGNFDKAIEKAQKAIKLHSIKRRPVWDKSRRKTEKDIEWLSRREYNPFLWKAWMLMGRSQFHQGSFDEAASTFSYMSRLYRTQPAIYGKARAWLAKCYIEQDWLYDAEDVINKMRRDSIDWRARKEWDYTMTDYYIHTKRYEEAIPYLKKVIKHEMRRKQKAREWFLLGQLYAALGQREDAYNAYRHVVRMNPPYELDFNARIAMTEVMAGGNPGKMISKLKRMARSEKNSEYLDQVYYAMGNIYLLQRDTMSAIGAYEQGNEKGTRSGIEKGVLLLRLGDLYWDKERFSDAQRCYGAAIGLLDKERDDYEQLSERSKVLDKLVPYTEAVHLQDSLQVLAKLPEAERNAAIDRVIEELKKKEKEEKRRQQEADAQAQLAQQNATGNRSAQNTPTATIGTKQDATWYFYNPMAVSQGKQTFQQQWGKRDNVDNWQRVNKTVVAGEAEETWTDEQRDSIARAIAAEDSLKQMADSAQNDPHKREYYLKDIPFTVEQVAASNLIIMDGLHHSGVIFKDELDNLRLGEKQLRRLTDQYPSYEQMDEVYYHLFLLYMRQGNPQKANVYLNKLKAEHPNSQWTAVLTDPYFEENARFGAHLEDSLYAATYNAFKANRFGEVRSNVRFSESRFPMGANRDKFIFIGGLSKLNDGDSKGCLSDMQTVVDKYPESDVSAMAGMIINGVKAGRQLRGGRFDMGDVWDRRTYVLSDSDSIATRVFEPERNVNFNFLIVYQTDSVDENALLFEMARFNFTGFPVRNFDIMIEDVEGLHRMRLNGFRSYDEVLQYARVLYQQKNITPLLSKARIVIISDKNMELLGTQYSYEDYEKFYEKHFVPLKISTVKLLTEPATIEYEGKETPDDTDIPGATNEGTPNEEGDELYNGGVLDNETLLDLGIDPNEQPDAQGIDVPAEAPQSEKTDDGGLDVPADGLDVPAADDGSIDIPAAEPAIIKTLSIETPTTIETPVTTIPQTPVTPEADETTVVTSAESQVEEPQLPDNEYVVEPETEILPDNEYSIEPEYDSNATEDNNFVIPENDVVVPAEPAQQPVRTETKPTQTQTTAQPTQTQQVKKTEPKPKSQEDVIEVEIPQQPEIEDTGIDFSDDFGAPANNNTQKTTKKPTIDLEDEYYDLDGFY